MVCERTVQLRLEWFSYESLRLSRCRVLVSAGRIQQQTSHTTLLLALWRTNSQPMMTMGGGRHRIQSRCVSFCSVARLLGRSYLLWAHAPVQVAASYRLLARGLLVCHNVTGTGQKPSHAQQEMRVHEAMQGGIRRHKATARIGEIDARCMYDSCTVTTMQEDGGRQKGCRPHSLAVAGRAATVLGCCGVHPRHPTRGGHVDDEARQTERGTRGRQRG